MLAFAYIRHPAKGLAGRGVFARHPARYADRLLHEFSKRQHGAGGILSVARKLAMALRFPFTLSVFLLIAGCESGSPTQPRERTDPVVLLAYCNPAGTTISCSAFISHAPGLASQAEVTAPAAWTADPPDTVTLVAPGRFTPVAAGEVELRAQYQQWPSSPPNPRFLVAPGAIAKRLSTVFVTVRELQDGVPPPNPPPVAAAVVRIVEGYRIGATCTTAANGVCTLESIASEDVYSFVVSKEGYRDANVMVRGDLGAPTTIQVWLPRQ